MCPVIWKCLVIKKEREKFDAELTGNCYYIFYGQKYIIVVG